MAAVVSKASEPLGEGELVIVVVAVDLVMIECGGGMIDCHVIGRAQPRCTNFHVLASLGQSNFASSTGRENEAANLLIVNMVLIDRDSRELSNGCHVVFWSNLDLGCENPAVGLICKLPTAF
eukprot:scaffold1232_cov58-Skeletonema_dohrnii-CCMP3373.AAC.1